MKITKFVYTLIVLVLLYIYLHNPILPNGIGSCKLLYVLAFIYILIKSRTFVSYIRLFKTECLLLLILIAYSIFEFLASGEPNTMRLHMVGFMEYFVLPFFLINIVKLTGGKKYDYLIKYIMMTGCIGAVVTTACVVSPTINEFVRTTFNKAVLDIMDDLRANVMYRGFGISEALTYSYGIIQGMIFGISLFYYRDNKWVLPFLFFIILSAALNARTGIIIAVFGALLFFWDSKKGTSFYVVIALFIIVLLNLTPILKIIGLSSQTIDWLTLFFEETDTVFSNMSLTSSGTTSYMFVDMFVLPSNISEWLFGCGFDIYYSTSRRSDLGWIIQLNYGGLLYFAIELYFLFYLYNRLKNTGNKTIAIFLAVAFIISNTKGPALPNSGMIRLIMLLYCYYILKQKEIKILIEKNKIAAKNI